jgi:hypothetical protein
MAPHPSNSDTCRSPLHALAQADDNHFIVPSPTPSIDVAEASPDSFSGIVNRSHALAEFLLRVTRNELHLQQLASHSRQGACKSPHKQFTLFAMHATKVTVN